MNALPKKALGKGNYGTPVTFSEGWKKKSIFFSLPYWKSLLIRHNLDVMHIEKNICDNIVNTMLNVVNKSKDNWKAREDLKHQGIRRNLHAYKKDNGKWHIPFAPFSMTLEQRKLFCTILKSIRVPDGYSSNISRNVNSKDKKLMQLKSHDCHMLMQQLLPIALRNSCSKDVCSSIVELCNYFHDLCSNTLNIDHLNQMEKNISITLCKLEQIFPPSFFTVMVHLSVHLATEAKVAGPVHYRWMYPIERYLKTLKGYVRNKSQPEGSIAEQYIAEECLIFCSRYLSENVETKSNRPDRNCNGYIGKATHINLGDKIFEQAHRYVLFNTDETKSFRDLHMDVLRRSYPVMNPKHIERMHHAKFPKWFKDHIDTCPKVKFSIWRLSRGPSLDVKKFKGYRMNGIKFLSTSSSVKLKTQNDGILVSAETSCYLSVRDVNPIVNKHNYYGRLNYVVELQYGPNHVETLFHCNWFDGQSTNGIQVDMFGIISINTKRLKHQDEPFILAAQAQQCFYVDDPKKLDWSVVLKRPPRDF